MKLSKKANIPHLGYFSNFMDISIFKLGINLLIQRILLIQVNIFHYLISTSITIILFNIIIEIIQSFHYIVKTKIGFQMHILINHYCQKYIWKVLWRMLWLVDQLHEQRMNQHMMLYGLIIIIEIRNKIDKIKIKIIKKKTFII